MAEVKMKHGSLFEAKELNHPSTMILHCISSDYALGAGFALEIEKRFHIRETLKQIGSYNYPDCLVVNNVINMVTKGGYWTKPTYKSFNIALEMVRDYCNMTGITQLIMPKIGCGLDKLNWTTCRKSIEEILVSSGIDCIVYVL